MAIGNLAAFVVCCGLMLPLAGCAHDAPAMTAALVRDRARPASLAPSPPGWFRFCQAQMGPGAAACDAIPRAAAMPDGRPAMAPAAWHDFCRRHREDAACIG
jgi:predicted transglutaminase-like cysteine proteinase